MEMLKMMKGKGTILQKLTQILKSDYFFAAVMFIAGVLTILYAIYLHI